MKILLSVCLVLLISLFPGLSLAHSEKIEDPAIARLVNEISLATH